MPQLSAFGGSEEGVGSPGTGIAGGYEAPCGCWEVNLSPLEQQPVLLTTEPYLHLQNHVLKIIIIIEKKRGRAAREVVQGVRAQA